jgi:DNA-binding LacI/PurR family transcriptional regulator
LTSDSITPPVTIADIADAAGVSRATVSKVLNGRSDVAPGTRSQVERLLTELGYVRTRRTRNAAAHNRGGLIEILFNDASSPWAVEMIRGTEEAARAAHVGLVVSVLGEGPKRGQQWIEDMVNRNSRGVILALSQLSDADQKRLAKLGVPTILVDPAGDFDSDLPSIAANNWGGGMAATQHLIDLGHRRIGIIIGQMRYLFSQARLAGYRAALERANLPVDPRLIAPGNLHFDSAVESALDLLSLDRDLRGERRAGARRLHRRPAARPAGAGRPQRRRFRRRSALAMGLAAADHRPAAHRGDRRPGHPNPAGPSRRSGRAAAGPDRTVHHADRPGQHRRPAPLSGKPGGGAETPPPGADRDAAGVQARAGTPSRSRAK